MHTLAMGDLFTTVQQRAAIDLVREKGEVIVSEATAIPKLKHSLEVNGFYFKNHDKKHQATIWVNGDQLENTNLATGVSVDGINENTKTIIFSSDRKAEKTSIKAGQKIIIDNGKILDAYQ